MWGGLLNVANLQWKPAVILKQLKLCILMQRVWNAFYKSIYVSGYLDMIKAEITEKKERLVFKIPATVFCAKHINPQLIHVQTMAWCPHAHTPAMRPVVALRHGLSSHINTLTQHHLLCAALQCHPLRNSIVLEPFIACLTAQLHRSATQTHCGVMWITSATAMIEWM